MESKRILGIFALLVITTSILKLLGVSFSPIFDGYTKVATLIMKWFMPELFTGVFPSSVEFLAILIPFIFTTSLTLYIIQLVKHHKNDNCPVEKKEVG